MSTPTLSVIVPCYRASTLGEVLEAVRPLDPLEILVVDSSPEPPELDDPSIRLVHLPERATPARARNEGARLARGEMLLFVDADIVFTERTRRFVVDRLRDYPASTITAGLYKPDEGPNLATRLQNTVVHYRYSMCEERGGGAGGTSHLMILRDDFRKIGGFNEDIVTYEDIEFVARARAFDVRTEVFAEFEAIHKKHDGWLSLLRDYGHKAFNAATLRRRYREVFAGLTHNTWLLGSSWLGAAAILPTLALTAFLPAAAPLTVAALLLAFVTAVVGGRLCRGMSPLARLVATIYWIPLGTVITASAGLSTATYFARRLRIGVIEAMDFLRAGTRVLFRTGFPVQVIQYITGRCNLRCSHCFYKETLDAPDPGELDHATLERTARSLGPVLWYSLAGGEPFIRRDLVQVVDLVQSICRPKALTMPTNGWYVEKTFQSTQRILQRLERGNLMLYFSLDGPEDIHDGIRGEGSYARVKETVARLRPLQRLYPRLHLSVVTTVMEQNAAVAPDFIDEIVREFRPNAVSINLFRHHSKEHPPVPTAVIDAHHAAVERYQQHARNGGLTAYGMFGARILRAKEFVQKEAIQRVARHGEFVTPCTAGTLSYVFYEDGRMAPCEILDDSLGKITDDGADVRRMIRSPEARRLRRWIRDTKCTCTYECAMSTNTLFSWPLAGQLAGRVVRDLGK